MCHGEQSILFGELELPVVHTDGLLCLEEQFLLRVIEKEVFVDSLAFHETLLERAVELVLVLDNRLEMGHFLGTEDAISSRYNIIDLLILLHPLFASIGDTECLKLFFVGMSLQLRRPLPPMSFGISKKSISSLDPWLVMMMELLEGARRLVSLRLVTAGE